MQKNKKIRLSENITVEHIPSKRMCVGYTKDEVHIECSNKLSHSSKSGRCQKCNGKWLTIRRLQKRRT